MQTVIYSLGRTHTYVRAHTHKFHLFEIGKQDIKNSVSSNGLSLTYSMYVHMYIAVHSSLL